jgi:hypothetical protein
LHSADGTLIATTQTDSKGRFFFDTTFTGMGYIQVIKPAIYEVVAEGSDVGGIQSHLDPNTLRSGPTQFIDGFAVNAGLSFAMKKLPTAAKVKANGIVISRTDTGQTMFADRLMPRSYTWGFTVAKYDPNGDHTEDYLLITKRGTPQLFFVDGQSGVVTKINGPVSTSLQAGMVIQHVNLTGGSDQQYLLLPSGNRSGKITAIDLQTRSVLWTTPTFPGGRMVVTTVGAADPSVPSGSDIALYSRGFMDTYEVRNGSTGALTRFIYEGTQLVNAGGPTDPVGGYPRSVVAGWLKLANTVSVTQTPTKPKGVGLHVTFATSNKFVNLMGSMMGTHGAKMSSGKMNTSSAKMASAKMGTHVSHVTPSLRMTHTSAVKAAASHASAATHDAVMAATSVKALRRESRLAKVR